MSAAGWTVADRFPEGPPPRAPHWPRASAASSCLHGPGASLRRRPCAAAAKKPPSRRPDRRAHRRRGVWMTGTVGQACDGAPPQVVRNQIRTSTTQTPAVMAPPWARISCCNRPDRGAADRGDRDRTALTIMLAVPIAATVAAPSRPGGIRSRSRAVLPGSPAWTCSSFSRCWRVATWRARTRGVARQHT
jgi:hypothetical protein